MSTLSVADRDVVRRAVAFSRRERHLAAALVVERPKPRKNARRQERASVAVQPHCVYCGQPTRTRAVCDAHSDLRSLDFGLDAVVRRVLAGQAEVAA